MHRVSLGLLRRQHHQSRKGNPCTARRTQEGRPHLEEERMWVGLGLRRIVVMRVCGDNSSGGLVGRSDIEVTVETGKLAPEHKDLPRKKKDKDTP